MLKHGYFESPVGLLEFSYSSTGLCSLGPVEKQLYETATDAFAVQVQQQLREYFAGTRTVFTLPLSASGTAFQKQVWNALCTIPYGETRSYGQIALQIGNPKACRAVGMANHNNPIAIVVPCHRVIGANGKLTGYAGGLAMKQYLLDLERSHANKA